MSVYECEIHIQDILYRVYIHIIVRYYPNYIYGYISCFHLKERNSIMKAPIDEKYAPLLLHVGFAILDIGLVRDASTIFYASRLAWPHRIGPIIGQVMTCLHVGMHDMAIGLLEEAKMEHSNDPAIEAFLGLAYLQKGERAKAQEVLNSIAHKKDMIHDESVFFMAESLLSELQVDIPKKSIEQ